MYRNCFPFSKSNASDSSHVSLPADETNYSAFLNCLSRFREHESQTDSGIPISVVPLLCLQAKNILMAVATIIAASIDREVRSIPPANEPIINHPPNSTSVRRTSMSRY